MERQNQEIDKHNAAIRDLIVVSRTALTSIQELRAAHAETNRHIAENTQQITHILKSIEELREAQATTDEKLQILIDIVDRIIRHRPGSA